MRKSGLPRYSSLSNNAAVNRDDWQDRDFARGWDESGNVNTNPDRLNQLSLLADLLNADRPARLLDLGIGSAQVEQAIERRHPGFFKRCQVIGIDASEAMLQLARQRCEEQELKSVELLCADFGSLNDIELRAPPDAVICVQALHEVPHEVKRALFAWVHDRLPRGRPFYLLDRFEYPAQDWLDYWRPVWNWMRSRVSEEVVGFEEYHRRYRAKHDHVASLDDYRRWLEEAGFRTLCPYHCFNRAMIIATS